MNAVSLATAPNLAPSGREMKALRLFVSQDSTRPFLRTLWCYASDGGETYVATDGHTMAVRRSGTHTKMLPREIFDAGPRRDFHADTLHPPRWADLLHAPKTGKTAASWYSINPAYFARIGEVERAAGQREADDFVPRPRSSAKDVKRDRAYAKSSVFSKLAIPVDPLDGWYWTIATKAALWEGILMPRRP